MDYVTVAMHEPRVVQTVDDSSRTSHNLTGITANRRTPERQNDDGSDQRGHKDQSERPHPCVSACEHPGRAPDHDERQYMPRAYRERTSGRQGLQVNEGARVPPPVMTIFQPRPSSSVGTAGLMMTFVASAKSGGLALVMSDHLAGYTPPLLAKYKVLAELAASADALHALRALIPPPLPTPTEAVPPRPVVLVTLMTARVVSVTLLMTAVPLLPPVMLDTPTIAAALNAPSTTTIMSRLTSE